MRILFGALRILYFAYFAQNVCGRFCFPPRDRGFQRHAGVCSKGHCGDQRLIIACISS